MEVVEVGHGLLAHRPRSTDDDLVLGVGAVVGNGVALANGRGITTVAGEVGTAARAVESVDGARLRPGGSDAEVIIEILVVALRLDVRLAVGLAAASGGLSLHWSEVGLLIFGVVLVTHVAAGLLALGRAGGGLWDGAGALHSA